MNEGEPQRERNADVSRILRPKLMVPRHRPVLRDAHVQVGLQRGVYGAEVETRVEKAKQVDVHVQVVEPCSC